MIGHLEGQRVESQVLVDGRDGVRFLSAVFWLNRKLSLERSLPSRIVRQRLPCGTQRVNFIWCFSFDHDRALFLAHRRSRLVWLR